MKIKLKMIILILALIAIALAFRFAFKTPLENGNLVIVLAPLTGPSASLGEYVKNGVELACTELNSNNSKPKFTVEFLDTKNSPREGAMALQKAMLNRRPVAVISVMSAVSKAIAPLVDESEIFTIATTTSLTGLPNTSAHIVRVYPSSADYLRPSVDYMNKNHNRVALLYVDDDFGESNRKVVTDSCYKSNVKLVAVEPFKVSESDLRSIALRALKPAPDAVFVTGYGPAFVEAFKTLKELAPELPIYSELGFANPYVLSALGGSADGVIFNGTLMEISSSNPITVAFKTNYMEKYGKTPYQVSGYAYDSILFLQDVLTKKKSNESIKDAWIRLAPIDKSMGIIEVTETGDCTLDLKLITRTSGENISVKKQP